MVMISSVLIIIIIIIRYMKYVESEVWKNIFVVCIEKLALLISIAVDKGIQKPVCLIKRGPSQSHL